MEKDGVGPNDPQYKGQMMARAMVKATDGERNFDRTDKDESDQMGLTSLVIGKIIKQGPNAILA